MCARRFLAVVFGLTLIFVAAGFAIFEWGSRALVSQAIPKGHFQSVTAGAGPDYNQPSSWVARPGQPDDPSKWLPDGAAGAGPGKAAIFFIHSTTYLYTDRWNAPLDPGGDTEFRTRLFVESQASAFNGAGQVWAPRYRQAAFAAFLLKSDDAAKALDLAYRDVAAAFDQFVKEAGDRPIILAGHSQGALHLERLLREKVASKPIAKQIVAAYVVGWPVSTTADLPSLGLPGCKDAGQTGCILSWLSFGEPANPDLIFNQWARTRGLNGEKRRQEDALCVNPITGTENGSAPAGDNLGTLLPSANLTSARVAPGLVAARCAKGILVIDGSIPAFTPPPLPGNNFHVYDYALFWGSIRHDAEKRLASWHP